MGRITEMQYQYALERIEDLLPLVSGEDPNFNGFNEEIFW